MKKLNKHKIIGIVLLAAAGLLFSMLVYPSAQIANVIQVSGDQLTNRLSVDELNRLESMAGSDLLQGCKLELQTSTPEIMRVGSTQAVYLTGQVRCPVHPPNFASLSITSRLEEEHDLVLPKGNISRIALQDQPIQFVWSITPDRAIEWKGRVWVYLALGAPQVEMLIAAMPVEVQAVYLMGLTQTQLVWVDIGLVAAAGIIYFWQSILRLVSFIRRTKKNEVSEK